MTAATVQGSMNDRASLRDVKPSDIEVVYDVVDGQGNEVPTAVDASSGQRIHGPIKAVVNSDGTWSASLPAGNVGILPAGTRWRSRVLLGPGRRPSSVALSVPNTAGPHQESGIRADSLGTAPQLDPVTELAVFEQGTGVADITGLTIPNNLTLVPINGTAKTVPDSDHVTYLWGYGSLDHSVANSDVGIAIAPVGSTTLGQQIALAQASLGAIGKVGTPLAWGRLDPHHGGDYQLFVWSDTAGTVNVRTASRNPLRLSIEGR